MAKVTTKNGATFQCREGQSIIDAGLESGVVLEHSCVNGRCNSCKAEVIKGDTGIIQLEQVKLADTEDRQQILMCCRTAKTDLILDVEGLVDFELHKIKVLPSKIDKLTLLTEDVLEVRLRFPSSVKFDFNPGQYVDLITPLGVVRSYSIANRTPTNGLILQVKKYEGGEMSSYLFNDAKEGDLLRIRGPLGTFHERKRQVPHTIFIATGTGIAPILSMLELNIGVSPEHKISVYWGGRYYKDLYIPIGDLDRVDFFQPVLSREDHPLCERGYVQDVLTRHFNNFDDVHVYACGSNTMIDGVFSLLEAKGLKRQNFFSDAFVQSHGER